jgi:hypothetical protein
MGFDSLIRSGILLADGLVKSLEAPIVHFQWLGSDGFGKPTFAQVGTPHKAIVTMMDQQRFLPDGTAVTIKANVLILEPVLPNVLPLQPNTKRSEPIDPHDKIILPDGTSGPIIGEPGIVDPTTKRQYFADIMLGKP